MKFTLLKESFEKFLEEESKSKIQVQSLEDFVKSAEVKEQDEPEMLGADVSTLTPDELKGYLKRSKEGEKTAAEKYKMPYVHKQNIPVVSAETGEEFDLDALAKSITERPAKILKQNEKIQHSGGGATIYFNIGLPALRGLAFNEKKGEFVVVNTCPGAGACKVYCYAKKGGYVQWKASSMSQTRLLNFLLNDPQGFEAQLSKEIGAQEAKWKGKNVKIVIRWHDAGDFFSDPYLKLAYSVASAHPEVEFYAYTKMADVAKGDKPKNFIINFSMGALPSQEKQISRSTEKHSDVVKKDLFDDLIVKSATGKIEKTADGKYKFVDGGLDTLKDRMAKKYNIDKNTIITYDEMMKIPTSDTPKYNVIVAPGDGDDAANRKDVIGTYLLIH